MDAAPYDERLGVPLRWWVQGVMLVASLWLALVVAVPALAAWLVHRLALALLAALLRHYGSARVSVADGWFRAGRARIEARAPRGGGDLDAEATRRVAGPEADARAYLLLRPYLKRAVRVEITDPADPAPYWLVCTRHPDELAAVAIAAAGGSAAQCPRPPQLRGLLGTVLPWHRTAPRCGPSSRWWRGSARPR